MKPCENSEVLPEALVTVALTTFPVNTDVATLKKALPLSLVVTVLLRRKVSPSPKPEGFFDCLEKNWMVKVFLGRLFSIPFMVVPKAVVVAEASLGKFCRLFGPASGSLGSLGVLPSPNGSGPRSIPRSPFEKMEFLRMQLPGLER